MYLTMSCLELMGSCGVQHVNVLLQKSFHFVLPPKTFFFWGPPPPLPKLSTSCHSSENLSLKVLYW